MAELFDIQEQIAMRMDLPTLKSFSATSSTWYNYIKDHRDKFNRLPISTLHLRSIYMDINYYSEPLPFENLESPLGDPDYSVNITNPDTHCEYGETQNSSETEFFNVIVDLQPELLSLSVRSVVIPTMPVWWLSTVREVKYLYPYQNLDLLYILSCAPKIHHLDIMASAEDIPYTPLQVVKAMNAITFLSLRRTGRRPNETENGNKVLEEVAIKSQKGFGLFLLEIKMVDFTVSPRAAIRFFENTKFYDRTPCKVYFYKVEGGRDEFFRILEEKKNYCFSLTEEGFLYKRDGVEVKSQYGRLLVVEIRIAHEVQHYAALSYPLIILITALIFLQIVSNTTEGSQDFLQKLIKTRYPDFEPGKTTISGVDDLNSFGPEYPMSTATRILHQQFIRALTYQAVIPSFFFIATVSFNILKFDIFHHPALEKMDTTRIVFMAIHTFVGLSGCIFNLTLIYLAFFHSPRMIQAYATLIINFAFSDFLSCVADMFTQQSYRSYRINLRYELIVLLSEIVSNTTQGTPEKLEQLMHRRYPDEDTSTLMISGIDDVTTFAATFTTLHITFPIIPIYFIILYIRGKIIKTLSSNSMSSTTRSLHQQLVRMISSSIQGPTDQVLDILYEHDPGFKARYVMVSGVSDMTTLGAAFFVWDVSLPIIPIYITILIIRSRIIRSLSFYSANMSSETKNLHKQLLTALTYQACIPIFFLIGVVSFTLEQMKIVRHPALGYTTVTGLMYNFMLHLLTHSLYSLLLSFSYRCYILLSIAPKKRVVLIILAIIYIPSCFQLVNAILAESTPEELDKVMNGSIEYDTQNGMVSGYADISSFGATFTASHVSFPIFPIYAAILLIRMRIVKKLRDFSSIMSNETKNMHKQLLKALTYQACIPMCFAIGVITFALGKLNIFKHPAVEYTTPLALMCISVLTPIASLVFVRPYRKKMEQIFGIGSANLRTVTVTYTNPISSI
ncbi:unnamed protein product [Caenorhabditis auriculariae]|uniref:G protein-coupled receptor n=1 Tax=Caenorhabditis auriculariae TaxID=2777116 RepID=A0A8S1HX01_9PELO|nr:unnamed protein product [Caenorhabditis auriculariae]